MRVASFKDLLAEDTNKVRDEYTRFTAGRPFPKQGIDKLAHSHNLGGNEELTLAKREANR